MAVVRYQTGAVAPDGSASSGCAFERAIERARDGQKLGAPRRKARAADFARQRHDALSNRFLQSFVRDAGQRAGEARTGETREVGHDYPTKQLVRVMSKPHEEPS